MRAPLLLVLILTLLVHSRARAEAAPEAANPGGEATSAAPNDATPQAISGGSRDPRLEQAVDLVRRERLGDAIDLYQRMLLDMSQVEGSAEERALIERELYTLRSKVAGLTITITFGQGEFHPVRLVQRRKLIGPDGKGKGAIENMYVLEQPKVTLALHPGVHYFEFHSEGGATAEYQLELPAGSVSQLKARLLSKALLAPTPAPLHEPARSWVPFGVAAGITGALLVGTAATGLAALEQKRAYNRINDGSDPSRAARVRDRGVTLNLATDVLAGLSALSTLITVSNYPRLRAQKPLPHKPRDRRYFPGVQVGTNGGAVSVGLATPF